MTQDELIAKYPKIFEMYKGNPSGVNWNIPNGWVNLVDTLCSCIQSYVDNVKGIEQVRCMQMKEKFAGLRFYTFGCDDAVTGMIELAEDMSYKICQECGTTIDVGMIKKNWLITICRTCCIAHGDKEIENWEPNK